MGVAFSADFGGSVYTGAGAIVVLEFTTVWVNDGNGYDGISTFTLPPWVPQKSGVLLSCHVLIDNITPEMTVGAIWINTTSRPWELPFNPSTMMTADNQAGICFSCVCDMEPGDTAFMNMALYNGAGNTATVGGGTFSGGLL